MVRDWGREIEIEISSSAVSIIGDLNDERLNVGGGGDFNQNPDFYYDTNGRFVELAIQNMDHFQPCAERV